MKKSDDRSGRDAKLRKRAEDIAGKTTAPSSENIDALSPEEMRSALHELRVHQIELLMQNDELRRTQVKLDASRAKYFNMYNLAPVGYVTLGETGLILEANLTAAAMLGEARGSLIDTPLTRYILKDDQDVFYHHRRQFLKVSSTDAPLDGAPQICDLRMVKKDGAIFWAHLESTVAKDIEGETECRIVISDITRRKRAEENLIKNAVLLRETEKMAKIGGWVLDVETMTQTWTEETFHILEIDTSKGEPEVPEGLGFITPAFRPMAEEAIKRAVECGESYDQEWEIITAKGNIRWVHSVAKAYRKNGKTISVSGSFQDITERKMAEEALWESRKYMQLAESSLEGYWILNKNNAIIYINPKLSEFIGYSIEEIAGISPEELIDPINLKIFIKHLRAVKKDGKKIDDIEFANKSGSRKYIRISSTRIDKAGIYDGLYSMMTDMTEYHALEEEVELIKQEISEKYSFSNLVGKSRHMKKIFEILKAASNSECNVLIDGPSGTGKSIMARAIHEKSGRAAGPFVVVNCSAIPETLLESELFGYVKGAFTDARNNKAGKFAAAKGGTIFLDEIAEMPLHLQVKLLTVIEERSFEPLGSNSLVKADVRIIAATNRDIEKCVGEGNFRTDLYHRLKVVHINIPPLSQRKEDIDVLIDNIIEKLNDKHKKNIKGISKELYKFFIHYEFPGNVRELLNLFEYAFIFCNGEEIGIENIPVDYQAQILKLNSPSVISNNENEAAERTVVEERSLPADFKDDMFLKKDLSKTVVMKALIESGGNRMKAAAMLRVSRMHFWRKMKEYHLI